MLCSSRHTVETATVRRPRHSRAGLLKPYHHRAALSTRFRRKRHKADAIAAPARMLDHRAFVAAPGAASALTQPIARYFCAPADDGDGARQRRFVLAAVTVHPNPRRRSLQFAQRRPLPRR